MQLSLLSETQIQVYMLILSYVNEDTKHIQVPFIEPTMLTNIESIHIQKNIYRIHSHSKEYI